MALREEQDAWQQKAACRGPQAIVVCPPPRPERREEKRQRDADATANCTTCAVRGECLAYALDIREQHGIWGGLSENERKELSTV